jgi:hypothetical protein
VACAIVMPTWTQLPLEVESRGTWGARRTC